MSDDGGLAVELPRLRPVPAALLVYAGDDAPARRVAVPGARKRWSQLARVLDGMAWESVEAVDASGAVLGVWRRGGDDAPAVAAAPGLTIRERELAQLVLTAFRESHQMFQGMFGSLLTAVRSQLEQTTQAGRQLTSSYEQLLVVQRQTMQLAASESADDGDGEGSGLGEVVQALVARELSQAGQAQQKKRPIGKGADRPAPKK